MSDPTPVHALRDRPNASMNNPNLSDFICSCGQEFIACDFEPSRPRGTPGLAAIHRVAEGMKLAGKAPWAVITDAFELADIPELSVVEDANGRLARRWARTAVQWRFQDGTAMDQTNRIVLPVKVWWIPEERRTEFSRRHIVVPACWCGSERGPRTPADNDGNGCLGDVRHANYVPALDEPRWIEGWKAAMDWLVEVRGAEGIELAHEMETRIPAEYLRSKEKL